MKQKFFLQASVEVDIQNQKPLTEAKVKQLLKKNLGGLVGWAIVKVTFVDVIESKVKS